MSDIEVWKRYPEFWFVEASTLGRIRTLDRIVIDRIGRKRFVKGKIIKQHDCGKGYMQVHLGTNGKGFIKLVHRLVAQTFLPNPNNWPEVNHKDGDPTNNSVSNLEWCTHEYNIQYREKYGVSPKDYTQKSPVIAINLKTLKISEFQSQREAGRQLGVSQGNINSVIKGRLRQTGGYWFTNADNNAIESTIEKFGDSVARKVKELIDNKEMQSA